jgi:threonine aldolase
MNKLQAIDFRSDNVAPAADQVVRGIEAIGHGTASPYGDDDATQRLATLFSGVFGRAAVGWPVPTGTAANAMTIGALLPEGGVVVCHERAHALRSEEGATIYANPRIQFIPLQGNHGRLDPAACEAILRSLAGPKLLTLTQANEYGCAYDLSALSELSHVARRTGARMHIDGARFAAACCALGISPRDIVAAARPDALSLGLTKVGAISTDAAIFFDPSLPQDWRATMRRAGFLISKMRYQSIQIGILLNTGLWLDLARHGVDMARHLRQGLESARGVIAVRPSQSNVLLVEFSDVVRAALATSPFLVKQWLDPQLTRLVTSHATQLNEVDHFISWVHAF